MFNIPALIFPYVFFSESAGLAPRLVNLCNPEAIKRPNSLPNLVKILSDVHYLLSRDASKGGRDDPEGPAVTCLQFSKVMFHTRKPVCTVKKK